MDNSLFDDVNEPLTEQNVMVPVTGRSAAQSGEVMFRLDMDGKPAIILKQFDHNAVQMLFGVTEVKMTAYDLWRIMEAWRAALLTLPLDLERAPAAPQPDD